MLSPRFVLLPLAAIVCFSRPVPAQQAVHLTLIPNDAAAKLGGGRPQLLPLTDKRPDGLKKVPPSLLEPRYGLLTIGSREHPAKICVIFDAPESKKSRLFVDTNGDGDLTNDPPTEWAQKPYGDGLEMNYGGANVKIRYGSKAVIVRLGMFRFDPKDEHRKTLLDKLVYFSDYAYEGSVLLGGATYKVLLSDDRATGDYRGQAGEESGVRLLIDVNGNGIFDRRGESYDVMKPFNIKGTTYEIKNMTAAGDSFQIVPSAQTVPEILPPNNVSAGQPALAFDAVTTGGQPVHFPADYKGKLVLLNFWDSDYALARSEISNLVTAYAALHDQNLEMLGVSLDRPNTGEQLAAFLTAQKADWPQIYDGKIWDGPLVQAYSISNIPHSFLIDGDSGKIVAEGDALHGAKLLPTLKAALEKKNRK